MFLLWAIIFLIAAILLGVTAFSGIAVAISFFSKVLFVFSLLCFLVAFAFLIAERVRLKVYSKDKKNVSNY